MKTSSWLTGAVVVVAVGAAAYAGSGWLGDWLKSPLQKKETPHVSTALAPQAEPKAPEQYVSIKDELQLAALQMRPGDRFEGDIHAPVQVVEYMSMTCSHCAEFYTKDFDQVKRSYIDTGKVRFIVRDLPWDNMALAVSKIVRCAPQDKAFGFMGAYFSSQRSWVLAKDPLAEIKKIARLGGMSDEQVTGCLADQKVHDYVLKEKTEALENLKIEGTPTFFVNGVRINGITTVQDLTSAIDAALKK